MVLSILFIVVAILVGSFMGSFMGKKRKSNSPDTPSQDLQTSNESSVVETT